MPIRFVMEASAALFQFLGSLAAILALAWLAARLRLGPAPRLADETAARLAADEAVSGFDAKRLAIDRRGAGAILQERDGRILVLRPHGTHFAGRVLTPEAAARMDGESLVIDTAERRFGTVTLDIAEASAWVQAVEAIGCARNA